jgi:hypothetical protein
MEKITKKPVAVLSLREKEVKENSFEDKLDEFCRKLK